MNNNKKWATFHIWMLFVCLINYLCRTRVVYDIQAKYTFDIKTEQRSIRPISEKKKKYVCFDRKQLFFSICISSFNANNVYIISKWWRVNFKAPKSWKETSQTIRLLLFLWLHSMIVWLSNLQIQSNWMEII